MDNFIYWVLVSLTVIIVVSIGWFLYSLVYRTKAASESTEKLNQKFKQVEAEHRQLQQKMKEATDLKIDKDLGKLGDKLEEMIKKMPDEYFKRK